VLAVKEIRYGRNSMISNSAKRSILRWVHVVLALPILSYIYSPFEDIPNYTPTTRYVFVPIIIAAGGVVFAIIGVGLWLGAYRLSGVGASILSGALHRVEDLVANSHTTLKTKTNQCALESAASLLDKFRCTFKSCVPDAVKVWRDDA